MSPKVSCAVLQRAVSPKPSTGQTERNHTDPHLLTYIFYGHMYPGHFFPPTANIFSWVGIDFTKETDCKKPNPTGFFRKQSIGCLLWLLALVGCFFFLVMIWFVRSFDRRRDTAELEPEDVYLSRSRNGFCRVHILGQVAQAVGLW